MLASAYLDTWLDTFVRPFRAENTVKCYRRAFASLPASILGLELAALDGMLLQAAINGQAKRHPRAAQLTFAALHVAMAKAVQLGYIPRSPMDACIKPRHTAAKAQVLTVPQLTAYIQQARQSPCYVLLLCLAVCGLRRGEALGLTWRAIDQQAGVLHVTQQRMRVSGGYVVRPLKSAASTRDIILPPPLLAILAQARADQRVVSLSGWVVDATPERLAREHAAVLAAAGLPHVTLHGLRHSMACGAVASGCPIKVLQGILGHAKYELTANLYADHITADISAPYIRRYADSIF